MLLICKMEEKHVLPVCLLCSDNISWWNWSSPYGRFLVFIFGLSFPTALCMSHWDILVEANFFFVCWPLQSATSCTLAPQVWYYWPSLDYFHFQFSVSHLIPQDSFNRSRECGMQKWSSWGYLPVKEVQCFRTNWRQKTDRWENVKIFKSK